MPRVEWKGGPLDGCSQTLSFCPQQIWVGPDPGHPKDCVVVYLLYSDNTFRFDQQATNKANRWMKKL